jgi:hypothetical protein
MLPSASLARPAFSDDNAELRALLASPRLLVGVISACFRLTEDQTKIGCAVIERPGTGDGANRIKNSGTFNFDDGSLRLEPSNLLCELLAALRALEWPQVPILVQDALLASVLFVFH